MGKFLKIKNSKFAWLEPLLDWIFRSKEFEKIDANLPNSKDVSMLVSSILKQLDIHIVYDHADLDFIPAQGPLIVVANHPFGGLEGLILVNLLIQVRPDVKVLANYFLKNLTPIADLFIAVDPFTSTNKKAVNIHGLREAIHWLEQNGVLIVFPSGTVSHWQMKYKKIIDPAWHKSIARLALTSNATILPIFIRGKNSWYFQLAGFISPYLRSLLLPQQLLAKRHWHVSLEIGCPISQEMLKQAGNTLDEKIDYLRELTYLLSYRTDEKNSKNISYRTTFEINKINNKLIEELQQLPIENLILEQGDFVAYIAKVPEIDCILEEIGRLREITFSEIGEGTGHEIDLDEFDQHYSHLFIWNKKDNKIVGAYRLGLTDQIVPKYGVQGLYISKLYTLSNAFVAKIDPAIELGRSFVVKAYQKNPVPLLLLWKAIARFCARHPQYIHYYGLVSISNAYNELSHNLIVKYFLKHHFQTELARLIKAKHTYNNQMPLPTSIHNIVNICHDLDELDQIIRMLEYDHKGLPILLRQYNSLGMKVVGFNVDPHFNHCLDCLIIIRIVDIPYTKLQFYMGKENCESYMKRHRMESLK